MDWVLVSGHGLSLLMPELSSCFFKDYPLFFKVEVLE
jgi:hypothetical protein